VTDALLAASGMGDIGEHFPDTDPRWKGADSMAMLGEIVGRVRASGATIVNIDCTVIAEAPKLAPRKAEMISALTNVVGAPVTVKGRRAESMGALGRREGIAALAVALVIAPA
jgi:2-C-methyl-D-erythritol 2,4-cyclodiphosphate synthase